MHPSEIPLQSHHVDLVYKNICHLWDATYPKLMMWQHSIISVEILKEASEKQSTESLHNQPGHISGSNAATQSVDCCQFPVMYQTREK